jgi:hypothetical protein
MKKSLSLAICLVLLSALFMSGSVLAAPVTTYSSGFQIQNLSQSDDASINIYFYNRSDGSLAATQPATVPAGSFSSFFTLTAVSAGFDGSVVIESSQPVAVVSILHGNDTEHTDTYSGFSSGATTVYLPLIQKNNNGVYSFYYVQNTGTSDAHITVNYPGTYTGSPCPQTATIKAGASARFDLTSDTCLPTGPRAATITSDTTAEILVAQPIAAVVVHVRPDNATLDPAIISYTGFTTIGSTNPIFPLVSSGWYGSVTGIQIQNTGTTDTNVTITYTPSATFPGVSCTETRAVLAGQSTTFANQYSRLIDPLCRTTDPGTGYNAFVGVGRVTGNSTNQTLVAIVNNSNTIRALASSYDGFDPATATTAVAFPLVVDRYNGITSGMSLVNVSGNSADVTCIFTGTSYTLTPTIPAGASVTYPFKNLIANGYVGSANCTSTQSILGIMNYNTQLTTTDAVGQYAGINH